MLRFARHYQSPVQGFGVSQTLPVICNVHLAGFATHHQLLCLYVGKCLIGVIKMYFINEKYMIVDETTWNSNNHGQLHESIVQADAALQGDEEEY